MNTRDLEPGDVVQLKSGGPKMTYEGPSTIGQAICCWFDGNTRQREGFSFCALRKA